jgi:hypothetical protein
VRIFDRGERIFRQNITSPSFNVPQNVPPGLLLPGHWYSWQVIAMDNANGNRVDYRSNGSQFNFYTTGGPTPPSQPLTVKIVPDAEVRKTMLIQGDADVLMWGDRTGRGY